MNRLKSTKTSIECKHCLRKFEAHRSTAKFCSSTCRSQFWMTKNNQKVVTFMVPQEHEEEFVRSVKQILDTYRVQKKNKNLVEQKVFDDVNELKNYLNKLGFKNFRLPSMIHGAFYDKGLTVKKKLENSWEVRVNL